MASLIATQRYRSCPCSFLPPPFPLGRCSGQCDVYRQQQQPRRHSVGSGARGCCDSGVTRPPRLRPGCRPRARCTSGYCTWVRKRACMYVCVCVCVCSIVALHSQSRVGRIQRFEQGREGERVWTATNGARSSVRTRLARSLVDDSSWP